MRTKISNYLRAGYSGMYLVSAEEQRIETELKAIADHLSYHLHFWSVVDGLVDGKSGQQRQVNDPLEALDAVHELPEKSLVLLRDFHLFLQDPNPILLRKLKDVLQLARTQQKTLIILGCRLILPPELERELIVLEFALPDPEALGKVLDGIVESARIAPPAERDSILAAGSGLTCMEAENAFALSVVETGHLDPTLLQREKAQALKKNGLLEIVNTRENLDSIGGLEALKAWLLQRKHSFSQRARDYQLPPSKGLLILGIAGSGKSLTAKATAKVFGVPLLKLDAGRIFASLVGQSESNLRSVIQTAEAIAPCCLWVDELDKSFAGSKSSGSTDGGTSSRVLGTFLNWMQEKTAPVFVVATANDVSLLPPELLRKGRWDELFFVDLPNQTEREAIWNIVIAKYSRNPRDYDVKQLARATEGLTGSEIEGAYVETLYQAFEAGTEPEDLTLAKVLNDCVPLSRLMAEEIGALRNWAKGRARLASSGRLLEERSLRKLA